MYMRTYTRVYDKCKACRLHRKRQKNSKAFVSVKSTRVLRLWRAMMNFADMQHSLCDTECNFVVFQFGTRRFSVFREQFVNWYRQNDIKRYVSRKPFYLIVTSGIFIPTLWQEGEFNPLAAILFPLTGFQFYIKLLLSRDNTIVLYQIDLHKIPHIRIPWNIL